SFAGDDIYISPQLLSEDGLLDKDIEKIKISDKIDYENVRRFKGKLLKKAYKKFKEKKLYEKEDYKKFLNFEFVYNYAVFLTLKKQNNMQSWNTWPKDMKNWIKDKKLDLTKYEDDINYEIFVQYIFYTQWMNIKKYANKKGIKIMGDIPIYVGLDSLDVWENQKAFLLNRTGSPKFIAGVPPDYFSKTGQRWGNPIYDWDYIKEHNYDFWINRISYNAQLYDIIRIDHFRGFDTYWKINAKNKTAMKGEWVEAPGHELFTLISKKFKNLEIVAEDLGDLRKEVIKLRDDFNLKGMKIIQFTFDPNETNNDFEDRKNMIIYTGTHDNQTVMGFYNDKDENTKYEIKEYFKKHNYDTKDIHKGFLQMCMESIADYAIVPVQDIIGLDDKSRLNTPGTLGEHNWSFKLKDFDEYENNINYINTLLKKTKRI
ncbi:MAG: 4-alpha-glucanotransferase, partial [Peptostreptococcaceae bacterium]|nr:4-alpha-glucanotransferase [Peptostreptococcaceae bacterium]